MPVLARSCGGCGTRMVYNTDSHQFSITKQIGKAMCPQCAQWQRAPS